MKETYKIILDEPMLVDFIENFLPDLQHNETFYCCLFARSKYIDTKLSGFNNDKSQLKRFTANKQNLLYKIKQLEVPIGSYIQHNKGTDEIVSCPEECLALYIHPNPRSQSKANKLLIKKLVDILDNQSYNIHTEALSAIQKSPSKKHFVDFDFDNADPNDIIKQIIRYDLINIDALNVLKTRGGFHLIVTLNKVSKAHGKKNWYNAIHSLGADIVGDCLIPVPGTSQGLFIPHFTKNY